MLLRVAGLEAGGLLREPLGELVRDPALDDDPARRHADLPLVQERAEGRGVHRVLEIGVREDDQRVVAAELEDDALEVAARRLGELPARLGRAGEVDPAHVRVLDQLVADLRRLARRMGDDVQDARGKAGLGEDLRPEQPAGPRRLLRRLEHDGVAERERRGDRARREDQRRVPGRDRPDDADRAAQPHRERPRVSEGMISPDRAVRDRGRLTEQARHEAHLEHAEAEAAARLAREQRDDLLPPALEDVGRLQEDALPLGGRRLRPRRERRRGRLDRASRVLAPAGRNAGDDVAGERVEVVERRAAVGVRPTRRR